VSNGWSLSGRETYHVTVTFRQPADEWNVHLPDVLAFRTEAAALEAASS
jgi:hypothetical protein